MSSLFPQLYRISIYPFLPNTIELVGKYVRYVRVNYYKQKFKYLLHQL